MCPALSPDSTRIRSSLSILPEQPSGPVEQARELFGPLPVLPPFPWRKWPRLRGPFPLPAYPGVFHPFWGNTLPLSAFPPVGNSLSAPTRDSFHRCGRLRFDCAFPTNTTFPPYSTAKQGLPLPFTGETKGNRNLLLVLMGNLTMVGNPATGSQLHVTEDGKEREALLAASRNFKRDGTLSFPQMANVDFPGSRILFTFSF